MRTKTKKTITAKKTGLWDKMKKIKDKAIKSGELVPVKDKKELEKIINERRYG
ncbi:MAG: hypothetical protein L6Q54_02275 [Leptospiraceae bacterium]|nr:hypothetical protein [Leptospiraceae bacterium]MCK6380065.1 hypothetical protein [Leptospiraceae bacterium]NUM40658.1 hypothetical protein [Leptospiraceae bacterium]